MSEWFTTWLVWLLGVEMPPAGEGVTWQLEGAWRWSRPVVVLMVIFAVVAAAYVIYFYFRERSPAGRIMRLFLSALRLSLIFLVLLVMIFELRLNFSRTSLPYLAIVIDESASMETIDDYDDEKIDNRVAALVKKTGLPSASRLNIAKAVLLSDAAEAVKTLARRYTLKTYTIAESDRRQSADVDTFIAELKKLEAGGQASKLGANVRSVLNDLRGTQPAAVVVFTDGITTEGPAISEAAAYARKKAVPLYLVGIGSDKKVRDLEISDLLVDEIVFVDDYVDFDFKLVAYGLEGQLIELVLKNKETGEVLARKEVPAGADGVARRERLSYRPTKVGTAEYVVEVVNLKDVLKNKELKLEREIEVRDDPIKVLLVQGYPSFEYQYLKNLLERDETINYNVVLQEADPEYAEEDRFALRVFPVSREELFEYDVLILGDINLAYLTPSVLTNIAEFVKVKGGGLLFISGERFSPADVLPTPLADLLPVELDDVVMPSPDQEFTEGFVVRPTLLGLTSPHMQLGDDRAETEAIWRGLPEIYWLLEADKVKQTARVLAEHPTRTGNNGEKLPVMVINYVPPGKVLWHATDETYRWRYRLGDVIFARYWIQAIRYLSRSKLLGKKSVELAADKVEYERGSPVNLRARFFDERLAPAEDDGVTVIVEGNGTKKRQVKLQRSAASRAIFEGALAGLTVGNYVAWVAAPAVTTGAAPARFKVVSPPGEAARKEMDAADLKKAAERSRGRFYDVTTMHTVIDDLPRGRPVKVASMPPIVLWNNWRVLSLFLVLLVSEWLLRKRKGML